MSHRLLRFKPNRFQLILHHTYEIMLLIFFSVNSCVLAAVFADPSIRSEIIGIYDETSIIAFLVMVVLLSGYLSYKEYSKLYYYYQEKRKRTHHEHYQSDTYYCFENLDDSGENISFHLENHQS